MTEVEQLLKRLKRPATPYEIIATLSDVKGRRSVYSEIKSLLANGSIRKLEIDVPNYKVKVVVYVMQNEKREG